MYKELEKIFRTLLSEVYKNVMKPNGYKRDGQNFRQIMHEGSISKGMIVNFQRSMGCRDEELIFTINVAKLKVIDPDQVDPKFKEYDCELLNRKRPQHLCGKYIIDQWWYITPETDNGSLKAEIEEYLADYAIPWLRNTN
ncbi:MAG: DUF4304 domain-containing protein [Clostridia bacterium]|nr:DUF4304 domain-containing protein [Clostridia bacterium]